MNNIKPLYTDHNPGNVLAHRVEVAEIMATRDNLVVITFNLLDIDFAYRVSLDTVSAKRMLNGIPSVLTAMNDGNKN